MREVSSNRSSVFVIVFIVGLTLVLWIESGIDGGFWADDWEQLASVPRNAPDLDLPLARPLLYVPWWSAYTLTPESLIGTNLVAITLIAAKGLLIFACLRLFALDWQLAFAAAMLTVVYPVDNGQFYLGALSIHAALFGYLLGVYCWLKLTQTRRVVWIIPMVAGLTLSVGIYETVYPLIAFTPILWLLQNRRVSVAFFVFSAIWYVIPFLNGIRIVTIYTTIPGAFGYQAGLLSQEVEVGTMLTAAAQNYFYHFVTGWQNSIQAVQSQHWLIGTFVGIGTFAALNLSSTRPIPPRPALIGIVVGLLVIGLGFALYLPTPLRDNPTRTFYYSSVGAALAVTCVLAWLTSWLPVSRPLFAVSVSVLVATAFAAMLMQHSLYVERGDYQRYFVREFVTPLGTILNHTTIVIIDNSDNADLQRTFIASYYLTPMVALAYHDPTVQAVLCYPDELLPWGSFEEVCTFTDTGITVQNQVTGILESRYDQMIVLEYDPATGAQLLEGLDSYKSTASDYAPQDLINPTRIPPTFYTILDYPVIR